MSKRTITIDGPSEPIDDCHFPHLVTIDDFGKQTQFRVAMSKHLVEAVRDTPGADLLDDEVSVAFYRDYLAMCDTPTSSRDGTPPVCRIGGYGWAMEMLRRVLATKDSQSGRPRGFRADVAHLKVAETILDACMPGLAAHDADLRAVADHSKHAPEAIEWLRRMEFIHGPVGGPYTRAPGMRPEDVWARVGIRRPPDDDKQSMHGAASDADRSERLALLAAQLKARASLVLTMAKRQAGFLTGVEPGVVHRTLDIVQSMLDVVDPRRDQRYQRQDPGAPSGEPILDEARRIGKEAFAFTLRLRDHLPLKPDDTRTPSVLRFFCYMLGNACAEVARELNAGQVSNKAPLDAGILGSLELLDAGDVSVRLGAPYRIDAYAAADGCAVLVVRPDSRIRDPEESLRMALSQVQKQKGTHLQRLHHQPEGSGSPKALYLEAHDGYRWEWNHDARGYRLQKIDDAVASGK